MAFIIEDVDPRMMTSSERSTTSTVFSDAELAALYDVQNPWAFDGHPENRFVSVMVWHAESVLDVGCGTGSLLHTARREGHAGRLAGVDPDPAMLDRAKRRADIDWRLEKAEDITWVQEFELATMTSNAFQCLITDQAVRSSLRAVRTALLDGGRFVFGTRHVQARAWKSWKPSNAFDTTLPDGRVLRTWHHVEDVDGDVVTLTETTGLPDGTVLRADRGRLRFFDAPTLYTFLTDAGFAVEAMYGDWNHAPINTESAEIVTIACRQSS